MQSVEEFMAEFFRARTVEIKRELATREPFRKRFFAIDCVWDSRKETLERSESETIEVISSSHSEADVITHQVAPHPRLRYHLSIVDENWLIHSVDIECLSCRGIGGDKACLFCKGSGWLKANDQIELPNIRGIIPRSFRRF